DYLHDLVKYVDENVKDNNYEEFFKDTLLFGGDGHDPKKLEAFKQTPLYKEYAPSIFERKAGDEHYGNPYKYHKLLHSLVTRQFDKSWPIAVALINEDMPDRLDHQDMEKLKKSEFLVYDGRHRINVMKFLNDLREKGESGANLSSFEHFLYNKLKETYSSSSDGFPNKAPVLLVNNFNTETRSIPEWRKEVEKAESHFLPNSLEGRTLAQTPSSSIGNIHQVMSGRGDTERELGPHPTIGNLLTYRPTPTPTMKQEL
ncbi:MAG: hypothetical protein LBL16_04000, partial [Endomicrobium sp.]|nr:hypothetical protein [Endomicrobium sp.]